MKPRERAFGLLVALLVGLVALAACQPAASVVDGLPTTTTTEDAPAPVASQATPMPMPSTPTMSTLTTTTKTAASPSAATAAASPAPATPSALAAPVDKVAFRTVRFFCVEEHGFCL